MAFCCPIHGYYAPPEGTSLALCPECTMQPRTAPEPWENEHAERLAAQLIRERDLAFTLLREWLDQCAAIGGGQRSDLTQRTLDLVGLPPETGELENSQP